MTDCICDGSGYFWEPDASGESAHEEACPGSAHDDPLGADECDVCGLPDPYNGDGDAIGSCDCPRCDGGEAAASSVLCICPPEDEGADR